MGIVILEDSQISITDEISLNAISQMLLRQVEATKEINIIDAFDNKNFESVKKVKMGYVKNRNTISRVFLADRAVHTRHNKTNIEIEKKILAIMEQEENRLSAEIGRAESERVKEERKKLIPFRKMELRKVEATATDDDLLALSNDEFEKLLLKAKEQFLEIKEQERLRAEILENARKQAEKEKEEAVRKEREDVEKRFKEEKERAEKEKKDAEERAEAEKKDAEERAEKEKKRAIEQEREQQEEFEKKTREERERAEKNAKFLKWRTESGFDASTMEVRQNGSHFEIWTLPKKISEITI